MKEEIFLIPLGNLLTYSLNSIFKKKGVYVFCAILFFKGRGFIAFFFSKWVLNELETKNSK